MITFHITGGKVGKHREKRQRPVDIPTETLYTVARENKFQKDA